MKNRDRIFQTIRLQLVDLIINIMPVNIMLSEFKPIALLTVFKIQETLKLKKNSLWIFFFKILN